MKIKYMKRTFGPVKMEYDNYILGRGCNKQQKHKCLAKLNLYGKQHGD